MRILFFYYSFSHMLLCSATSSIWIFLLLFEKHIWLELCLILVF